MIHLLAGTALAAVLALNPPRDGEGDRSPQASGGGAAAKTAEASQQRLPDGWRYAEPGNACTVTRASGRDWVQLRLTRWRDLSDSILFHRPGLAPLWSEDGHPTGLTPAQEDADAEAGYRLEVRIDNRPIETVIAFNAMLLDHDGRPGLTYRFGIRQQPFLRALASGRILTLHRAGRQLASMPVAALAPTARRLAACVTQPTR